MLPHTIALMNLFYRDDHGDRIRERLDARLHSTLALSTTHACVCNS